MLHTSESFLEMPLYISPIKNIQKEYLPSFLFWMYTFSHWTVNAVPRKSNFNNKIKLMKHYLCIPLHYKNRIFSPYNSILYSETGVNFTTVPYLKQSSQLLYTVITSSTYIY